MVRSKSFTLIEILLVIAIIGLVAMIAIPNFVKAKQTAQSNAIKNKQRKIDAAVQQWLLEHAVTNELDSRLEGAPWGKIAYQIPKSLQLDSNSLAMLKLSPHKTFEELSSFFNTNLPAYFKVAEVQFGKKMKASLVSEPDTLKIVPKEEEIQPVSYVRDTTWSWYISARQPGKYWVHLKLELLVMMDGKDMPYPIVSHQEYLMVEATRMQTVGRFLLVHWQWIATTLALPIVYFLGRGIRDHLRKKKEKQLEAAKRPIGFQVRPPP